MKRYEALKLGKLKFESKNLCRKNPEHGYLRYTTSGTCVKCAILASTKNYHRRDKTKLPKIDLLPLPEHIVSREAPIEGKYFTGKRCNRGHLAWRYASTGNCVMCHAKANPPIKRQAINVIRAFRALGPAVVVWSEDEPPEGLPLIDRRTLGAAPATQTPCFLRFPDVPGMLEICRALHMTPIDEYVRNL